MYSSSEFHYAYILRVSVVVAFGGLLFGYDISVISGAIPFITRFFNLNNEWLKGFIVSAVYIGCMVGALVSGRYGNRYGRKKLLIISSILLSISAVGSGVVNNLQMFFLFRFIGGLGVGMAAMLSPMYISEIAPANVRGRFVALNQFLIVIGILFAYLVNYFLLTLGENCWRWMFIAEVIPSIIFFLSMFLVPETPRWLAKRGDYDKASFILNKIGNKKFANYTILKIKDTLKNESKIGIKELFHRPFRRILLIGIILAVFQQWSGINVVFFYAPDIFARTGAGIESQLLQTVIIGAVNVIFTLIAMWLVDKLGRKVLLLISSMGMAVSYIMIGIVFYTKMLSGYSLLIFFISAVSFYDIGLAPVTWVVISEIFPNKIREQAMAVATFFLWVGTFSLTFTFPVLIGKIKGFNTFWLYALICILGFVFILKTLPETKGKTLEEIERLFIKNKNKI